MMVGSRCQYSSQKKCPNRALKGSIYCGKHQSQMQPQNSLIQTGGGYLDVNTLTYNISWEAMEGKKIKDVDLAQICFREQENICLNNVAQVIIKFNDLLSLDFVALQEASNWEQILTKVQVRMPHMMPVNHGLYIEKQVVFLDSRKYEIQSGVWLIKSYLEDPGRPFMIIFLRHKYAHNNICVINMHPGHKGDFNQFEQHLKQTLMGNKQKSVYFTGHNTFDSFPAKNDEINVDILTKLHNNNIIMMGDMNFQPPNPYTFLPELLKGGRILYGAGKNYTCCDSKLQGNANLAYDHVLSSSSQIYHFVNNVNQASDHLPVVAQVSFEMC